MINKALLDFISEQESHLHSLYPDVDDAYWEQERVIKIGEEYGELCEAFLASKNIQRKTKKDKETSIEHEVADVLITTLLFAQNQNIDVNKALQEKISKIKARRKTD